MIYHVVLLSPVQHNALTCCLRVLHGCDQMPKTLHHNHMLPSQSSYVKSLQMPLLMLQESHRSLNLLSSASESKLHRNQWHWKLSSSFWWQMCVEQYVPKSDNGDCYKRKEITNIGDYLGVSFPYPDKFLDTLTYFTMRRYEGRYSVNSKDHILSENI